MSENLAERWIYPVIIAFDASTLLPSNDTGMPTTRTQASSSPRTAISPSSPASLNYLNITAGHQDFVAVFVTALVAATSLWASATTHAVVSAFCVSDATQFDAPRLTVRCPPAEAGQTRPPMSGRLIVSLIAPGNKLPADTAPNDAPFWFDWQPMFARDVVDCQPGDIFPLSGQWDHNKEAFDDLPPGEYTAAARFITNRTSSSWKESAGNWFSDPVKFTVAAKGVAGKQGGAPIASPTLVLNKPTTLKQWKPPEGVRIVEVRSALFSDFLGREVVLRAAVVPPIGLDVAAAGPPVPPPANVPGLPPAIAARYAAVYEVPGFGGTHTGAAGIARARKALAAAPDVASSEYKLASSTFWITLDPESPNGHTLFADSANNGPCGQALISELVPAIEAQFPIDGRPAARLLRGHSSGGWSTLWLGLNYPEVFGAVWSSSPDPIDFQRMQSVDIYTQANMYRVPIDSSPSELASEKRIDANPGALGPATSSTPRDITSFRKDGKPVMSVRQEAQGEDMLGANNTSGQQWDSWFATWGPRAAPAGPATLPHPAALFDPATGNIDRAVAEQYRKYDIGHLLRTEPARYGMLFYSNIRLVVGDADEFFLNEAVELLKADLAKVSPINALPMPAADYPGSITIVPGATHGTVFSSDAVKAFPQQMVEHLAKFGLARTATVAPAAALPASAPAAAPAGK